MLTAETLEEEKVANTEEVGLVAGGLTGSWEVDNGDGIWGREPRRKTNDLASGLTGSQGVKTAARPRAMGFRLGLWQRGLLHPVGTWCCNAGCTVCARQRKKKKKKQVTLLRAKKSKTAKR